MSSSSSSSLYGVSLSSNSIFPIGASNEEEAFHHCSIIEPFSATSTRDEVLTNSPLGICFSCGAYINCYCTSTTGNEWKCNICDSINIGVSIDQSKQFYKELQSPQYCILEPIVNGAFHQKNKDDKLLILLIDTFLCGDESFWKVIKHQLVHLPATCRVSIILLDHCIRILRLGSHTFTPLQMDVVAATTDGKALDALIPIVANGMYYTTVDFVMQQLEVIEQTTLAMAELLKGERKRSYVWLESVMRCLQVMQTKAFAAPPSLQALFFVTKPLQLHAAKQSATQNPSVSAMSHYQSLGKDCLRAHISVHLFKIGIQVCNIDELECFATYTSGSIQLFETWSQEHLMVALRKALEDLSSTGNTDDNAGTCLPTHRFGLVEVRCSEYVVLERITGPVLDVDSSLLSTSSFSSSPESGNVPPYYIDQHHLSIAHQQMLSSIPHSIEANDPRYTLEEAKQTIMGYCLDRATVCQVVANELEHTQIAVECKLKPLYEPPSRSAGIGNVWPWQTVLSRWYPGQQDSLPVIHTTAASMASTTSSSIASTVNHEDNDLIPSNGFIQVVIRFEFQAHNSTNTHSAASLPTRLTRIWTIPLVPALTKRDFLHSLSVEIWGLTVLRGCVADMHEEIAHYAMRRKQQLENHYALDESGGKEEEMKLKREHVQRLDNLLQVVARGWTTAPHTGEEEWLLAKLHVFARMIYHVREGPLLGGPATNEQESYLLRAMFLKASYDMALRMILPRLTLDFDHLQLRPDLVPIVSTDTTPTNTIEVPPESMFLLPGCVACIDFGDLIVVRKGPKPTLPSIVSEEYEEDELLTLRMESFAKQLAYQRCPIAKLLVLSTPGTPMDRLVYARLSPNHLQPIDLLYQNMVSIAQPLSSQLSSPQFLSKEDILHMQQSAPFTDQPYFHKYLKLQHLPLPSTHNATIPDIAMQCPPPPP